MAILGLAESCRLGGECPLPGRPVGPTSEAFNISYINRQGRLDGKMNRSPKKQLQDQLISELISPKGIVCTVFYSARTYIHYLHYLPYLRQPWELGRQSGRKHGQWREEV